MNINLKKNTQINWLNLPEEIYLMIFKYLKHHLSSLFSSLLVCKNWQRIINDYHLWKIPDDIYYPALKRRKTTSNIAKYTWAKNRIVNKIMNSKRCFQFMDFYNNPLLLICRNAEHCKLHFFKSLTLNYNQNSQNINQMFFTIWQHKNRYLNEKPFIKGVIQKNHYNQYVFEYSERRQHTHLLFEGNIKILPINHKIIDNTVYIVYKK